MRIWREHRGRFLIGTWLCLAAIWWILSTWLAPGLIRAGYEERSLRLVNDAFAGRDLHDVGHYLAFWSSLTRWGWLLLATLGLGLVLLWALQGPWKGRTKVLWGSPGLSPRGALELGAWLGIVLGFVEYAADRVWVAAVGGWSLWANPNQVWMLPLVSAFVLGGVAIIVCIVLGGRRRTVALPALIVPTLGLGVFGTLQSVRTGFHDLAIVVLALGIAVSIARALTRRRRGFLSLVRRTTRPGVALLVILGSVLQAAGWIGERRTVVALPSPPPGAPNVLLIVLDTVRAASLGLYGYGRATTPNLSRLASDAAVFDSAFSTSSWTLPSHASLFTGRFQGELGTDHVTPLDDTYATVAEALSGVGYMTGGFVANIHYAGRRSGVDRGFQHFEDFPMSVGVALRSGWLSHELAKLVPSMLVPRRDPIARKMSEDVNDDFLDWLSDVEDRPFFAFLNYFDAHRPYILFEDHVGAFPSERPPRPPGDADGRWDNAVDRYDSSIAHLDQSIADLMAALDDRGVLEHTIVMVTSDHGEHFGENGLTAHGKALYAPSVHVPLLVWAPGRVPARRVGTPVSIRDAATTILDLAGIDDLTPFPGLTLARHWESVSDQHEGLDAGATEGDPSTSESILMEVGPNALALNPAWPATLGPMKSLLSGGYQYIRTADGGEELYDLGTDPWQQFDLSDTDAGRREVARFRSELRARGLLVAAPKKPRGPDG